MSHHMPRSISLCIYVIFVRPGISEAITLFSPIVYRQVSTSYKLADTVYLAHEGSLIWFHFVLSRIDKNYWLQCNSVFLVKPRIYIYDTIRWTTDCIVCIQTFSCWVNGRMKGLTRQTCLIHPTLHQTVGPTAASCIHTPNQSCRPAGWMSYANERCAGDQSMRWRRWRHTDDVNIENGVSVHGWLADEVNNSIDICNRNEVL